MAKRLKILVVDDDATNILFMSSALKDEYEIFTALNGQDAVSQVLSPQSELDFQAA